MRPIGMSGFVLALFLSAAAGAAPPFIPVQGVLTNSAGLPEAGDVEVDFSIYAGSGGDPALWSETQTVDVKNGLFSVYLGQVNPLDLAMFRDHSELYLGIKVGEDSEMPRIYLGSTPYAGYAEYTGADALGSLTCGSWQVVKWNGSAWACANDNDTDSLAGLSCANGQVAKFNAVEWECADDLDTDTDTDTLADLSCNTGQVVKWSGSAWVCAFDLDDDTDTLADLSCAAGEVALWNGFNWICSRKVTWTSVEINLGSLNFTPGTISYDIPPTIPAGTREILVYFWVRKGGLATPTGVCTWKIYTQAGSETYFKKIMMHPWENQAITYNSDNQWFPITPQWQIHSELSGGSVGGDYSGGIEIIGYR